MQFVSRTAAVACLIAGLTVACSRGSDPTENVNKALKDAQLDKVAVKWDDDAHIAHLRGTVDTPTDKQKAQDVATAAVGTSGRVLNELTIRGVNDATADDLDGKIKSNLKRMISSDPTLKDRDVNFEVTNGVVAVKGEVQSAAEKSRVTELVREAPGVKDMANALEIKPKK